MSNSDTVPAAPKGHFKADEIILYGYKLYTTAIDSGKNKGAAIINIVLGQEVLNLRISLSAPNVDDDVKPHTHYSIAAIYGYAYDGHCYRFDKPRIFAFKPTKARDSDPAEEDAQGCGFGTDYKMWRLRKSDAILELNATFDSAAALVLDANLPGKRAPDTYRSAMQLAHRGGRLTST